MNTPDEFHLDLNGGIQGVSLDDGSVVYVPSGPSERFQRSNCFCSEVEVGLIRCYLMLAGLDCDLEHGTKCLCVFEILVLSFETRLNKLPPCRGSRGIALGRDARGKWATYSHFTSGK